ncbi:MAG: oligosaccharide flippase family protein [Limisphaerales bacterium]
MSIKRQSVWSLLPLLVTAVVSFFTMPLFLRFLGNDMYALWGYIITFNGMFGFADMGLGVAVGRYVGVALGKNDHEAVRGYWGTGNLIILPFLTLVSLAFIGLGVWLGPKWFNVSSDHVGLLRACFVAGGFGLFSGYYGTYWMILSQAFLDFKFISLLRVAMTLLQILPSIALAFFTKNPLLLLWWSAIVSLVQLGVFVWHARRNYHLGLNLRMASFARLREMAAYTGKMFFSLIIGSFFGSIDRVMLGKFAPTADFSPYFFSGNIAMRLQSLSVSVMGPVLFNTARLVESGREAAAKIYNETFAFMFEWYLLAAIWLGLWHPVLLRVWLVHTMGLKLGEQTVALVAPLLIPLVVACCLTSMANISSAQLSSLNRLGTAIGFTVAAGLLAVAGVWIGWQAAGLVGAAYGFLFSRLACVAQDLFTIRLLKAGGWLDLHTWLKMGAQGLLGAIFALSYFAFQRNSYWLLIPATLHAGLVTAWLVRRPFQKLIQTSKLWASN